MAEPLKNVKLHMLLESPEATYHAIGRIMGSPFPFFGERRVGGQDHFPKFCAGLPRPVRQGADIAQNLVCSGFQGGGHGEVFGAN